MYVNEDYWDLRTKYLRTGCLEIGADACHLYLEIVSINQNLKGEAGLDIHVDKYYKVMVRMLHIMALIFCFECSSFLFGAKMMVVAKQLFEKLKLKVYMY